MLFAANIQLFFILWIQVLKKSQEKWWNKDKNRYLCIRHTKTAWLTGSHSSMDRTSLS